MNPDTAPVNFLGEVKLNRRGYGGKPAAVAKEAAGARRPSSGTENAAEAATAVIATAAPPVWVPDEETPSCTRCDVEFWVFVRRHHCRLCGRVFCHDCSDHSTPIPGAWVCVGVRGWVYD